MDIASNIEVTSNNTRTVTVFEDTIYGSPIEHTYYAKATAFSILFDLYTDEGEKVGDDLTESQLADCAEAHFQEWVASIQDSADYLA